jgi:uracil phosphoribosyltransferase
MPIGDMAYTQVNFLKNRMAHAYGDQVHLMANPFLWTQLARLCEKDAIQPEINHLVRSLYTALIQEVVNDQFPVEKRSIQTRMVDLDSQPQRGVWTGTLLKKQQRVVTVDVARAGMLPSQICFDMLNTILSPEMIRQDHVIMARTTDENDQVTGAHFGESKIGGDIDQAIVLFPDPMGATGGSLSKAIAHYKSEVEGKASKIVAMNLIVTPEYVKRLTMDHPDVFIYTVRLDRGASDEEILKLPLGEKWSLESGLNEKQYILPGGGGFGEIINNSFC